MLNYNLYQNSFEKKRHNMYTCDVETHEEKQKRLKEYRRKRYLKIKLEQECIQSNNEKC